MFSPQKIQGVAAQSRFIVSKVLVSTTTRHVRSEQGSIAQPLLLNGRKFPANPGARCAQKLGRAPLPIPAPKTQHQRQRRQQLM